MQLDDKLRQDMNTSKTKPPNECLTSKPPKIDKIVWKKMEKKLNDNEAQKRT